MWKSVDDSIVQPHKSVSSGKWRVHSPAAKSSKLQREQFQFSLKLISQFLSNTLQNCATKLKLFSLRQPPPPSTSFWCCYVIFFIQISQFNSERNEKDLRKVSHLLPQKGNELESKHKMEMWMKMKWMRKRWRCWGRRNLSFSGTLLRDGNLNQFVREFGVFL